MGLRRQNACAPGYVKAEFPSREFTPNIALSATFCKHICDMAGNSIHLLTYNANCVNIRIGNLKR